MAQKTVWGVDIGNSAIKAVKMVREGNEARLVDFDIIDIQGVEEEGSRPARVLAALQSLVANHPMRSDPVFLSLPGEHCLFREFLLPPGSESRVEELVIFEAKQQIPFPLDQVEMGWERYEEAGGAVGVELIVVRKQVVQEILNLTDQCKLNVQGISVSPVAQFNFLHFEYNLQGPTLLLDAGFKGTDFVVMHGRHIYSRTIPIGGREITRALETKFRVAYDQAEELKKNIAQSKQAEKILGVIEPTLRQLGAEIQRSIGFYKSKSRGQRIQQVYCLGHTFRLPGMAESMAAQIREAPVTVVEGMKRIPLERGVNPEVFAHEFPTMAVALGLGIQGLGLGELKVNLLPKERITEITVGRKRTWAAVAAAAVLLALYVSYNRTLQERDQKLTLDKELEKVLQEANRYDKQVGQIAAGFPDERAKLEYVTRTVRDRGRLLDIFSKLMRLRDEQGQPFFGGPARVYLTGLYVSRIPFSYEQGALPAPVNPAVGGYRRDMLRQSAALRGPSSIYGFLAKGDKNPLDMPPGKRPDPPICVVLSGEVEGSDQAMFQVLAALGAVLKQMPGVIGDPQTGYPYTNDRRSGLTRKEVVPNVNEKGEPDAQNPVASERDVPYSVFHVVFRYQPPDDPDIVP